MVRKWSPATIMFYSSAFKHSVQFSHSVVSDSLRPHEPQHTRPPCSSPAPRVYPNSCSLSQWYHPSISTSVVPFSSCPQSFPALHTYILLQYFIRNLWDFVLLYAKHSVWHKVFIQRVFIMGFPGGSDGKESACDVGAMSSIPGSGRSPAEGKWLPIPIFLPDQTSLVSYSPCKHNALLICS